MRLGAALAVIRYNDGFSGVKRVLEMLGVSVGVHMSERFVQLDNRRILSSGGIEASENIVKVILLENSLLLNPIFERPTEEATN